MVDISMLDVMAALHTYRAKYYFVAGEVPKAVGTAHVSSVPLRAYRTKDTYIVIEAFMDHFWRNLCQVLGLAHLADDPRFNSRQNRLTNRDELDRLLEEAFLRPGATNRDRSLLLAWLGHVETGYFQSESGRESKVIATPRRLRVFLSGVAR